VLSSAFIEKGTIITINELGLANQQPHRQAFDGVTYFGCKKTVTREVQPFSFNSNSNSLDSSSMGFDEAATGGLVKSVRQKEIVNDYIIPVTKADEKEKHAGR